MSIRWSEKIVTRIDAETPPTMEKRVAKLEVMLAEALNWITELGDDMLDRTTTTPQGGIDG